MGPLDEPQRARGERLRARLAFAQRHGSDAPFLLLRAAKRLEPVSPALARDTYLEALGAAIETGQRASLAQAFEALRASAPAQGPNAAELLITGHAAIILDGRAAAIPILKRALTVFRSEPVSGADEMHTLAFAIIVATSVWDDETWHVLALRNVQLAREAGALTVLPLALELLGYSHWHAGEFAMAQALLEEAVAITQATGSPTPIDAALLLAGSRGVEAEALELIERGIQDAADRGEESTITVAEYASAVLYNGRARHEAALAAGQRSCQHHPAKDYAKALIEIVEAATRSGKPDVAAAAFDQLSEGTTLSGTDWALGIEARSRALLSDDEHAEPPYREAIERLARTRARMELGRAHLLYGEWLRRRRRRLDAREQLRMAHEMFATMGAEAFADRAARELLATGETARKRSREARDELTAQEANIARLAGAGLSNPEIGARLFISPRTVEYHLHKVFSKLEISSRSQLALALPGEHREAEPVP
jgi:DNA-binding CsgD family transcriptional regulator